jgi:glycosyltransferase involved in cell wall biosynthesis
VDPRNLSILIHDYAGHPFPVQLSRELARRGHMVVHAYAGNLLTPRGGLALKPSDPPSLCFQEVPMSSDYRTHKYSFFRRRGFEVDYGRELAKLVKRLRPEIIISGQTPTEPQWRMIREARRLQIPVVSWVQDFYSAAVARLARRKLPVIGAAVGWWYRHLDAKCFHASAGIVAITEDFVPILADLGVPEDRVAVIPNWAPIDELPVKPRRNGWSARHGFDDRFVFLYSGTLAMKHNPDLLRQLALCFHGDPAVHVVVISEGPGAEYLQRAKMEQHLANLTLLPFQPFCEMPEVLASADVLVAVLESDAGVFSVPSKVLSYHCAERSILGAMPRQNLAARIIGQAQSGPCVEPGDVAGFLSAAEQLRRDPSACLAMGNRARTYAEREFEIGRIADRFLAVIQAARGANR